MPLLSGFDFLRLGFDVAYRASDEPQLLTIDVTMLDRSTKRSAPMIVKRLIELINAGAACGQMFDPRQSRAERVSGPWDGPDAFGPDFSWGVRVAGVSPLFIRTIVDQLRKCGHEQPVTTMRIRGALPLDGTPASVDRARMLEWLEKPIYVDETPLRPFTVRFVPSAAVYFVVRRSMASSTVLDDALKHLAMRWLIATAAYVDESGRAVVRAKDDLERHLPGFHSDAVEFRAEFREFLHMADPSRAVLVNMLARLALTVAPFSEVEIGHPQATLQTTKARTKIGPPPIEPPERPMPAPATKPQPSRAAPAATTKTPTPAKAAAKPAAKTAAKTGSKSTQKAAAKSKPAKQAQKPSPKRSAKKPVKVSAKASAKQPAKKPAKKAPAKAKPSGAKVAGRAPKARSGGAPRAAARRRAGR